MQIFVSVGANSVPHSTCSRSTFAKLAQDLSSTFGYSRHDAWFQHAGRRCREEESLGAAGVIAGSTLQLHLRLRGGGGDGGATGAESRSSYLEMYLEKKPDKVDPTEERLARATTCKLSGQRLELPCVADELGSLYNKEAVVAALVSKSMPKALGHISSLKHVTEAKLCRLEGAEVESGVSFCCPISGQPLNGQHRFCQVLPSGHVVSEKAISQVPTAVEELNGGRATETIPLNGTKEEVEALWDVLIAKRAVVKKSKKERKKQAAESAVLATSNGAAALTHSSDESPPPPAAAKPNGKRQIQDFSVVDAAAAKKLKAADMAPTHADKKIWASLFTSTHGPQSKETYSCRSTSARGWI